jgi:FkbM family methyltransferase
MMTIKKLIKVPTILRRKIQRLKYNTISFSQYGEDSIIKLMLELYGLENVTFMDIGAHHPFYLNNTALLYYSGIRGVNIEPDPELFKNFNKCRIEDINLNIGIHNKKGLLTYYQFVRPEFNTFSLESAKNIEKTGIRKINEINVNVETYNNIVTEKLYGIPPDILFIDAEGFDELILESIDFDILSPKILCVETYAYGIGLKNKKLIDFIISKNYKIHADTFVNTIFIKSELSSNVIS